MEPLEAALIFSSTTMLCTLRSVGPIHVTFPKSQRVKPAFVNRLADDLSHWEDTGLWAFVAMLFCALILGK